MNKEEEKLENNVIRNEADYPKIFGLSEAEVIEVMEAVRQYSLIKDSQSYQDWLKMYNGIHKPSTFEAAVQNWLACIRWQRQKNEPQDNEILSLKKQLEERPYIYSQSELDTEPPHKMEGKFIDLKDYNELREHLKEEVKSHSTTKDSMEAYKIMSYSLAVEIKEVLNWHDDSESAAPWNIETMKNTIKSYNELNKPLSINKGGDNT